MKSTLIFGYGNPDRQDDGVAWHILYRLAQNMGQPVPESKYDSFPIGDSFPHLVFALQLTPEVSEFMTKYDRVCFVDAHTGAVPEEIHFEAVNPVFQASPFTHHLTPSTCLSMASALYHHHPEALLVSVRGYEFGFSQELSLQTADLVIKAVAMMMDWLESPGNPIIPAN